MKKYRTIFVVMMVAILGLSTSFEASAYDAKACSMVANKKSACNQGAEPFCDFISKFKTNKNFRKSRVKACSKSYCSDCIEGVGTICIGYDNNGSRCLYVESRFKTRWDDTENRVDVKTTRPQDCKTTSGDATVKVASLFLDNRQQTTEAELECPIEEKLSYCFSKIWRYLCHKM
jgi:hypothetical protein